MEKEIATVSKELAIFQPLNFKELNGSIEMLGNSSKNLSDKEKEIGVNLLGEWEHNVIDKLNSKENELGKIVGYIKGTNSGYYYSFNDDQKEKMQEKLACLGKTEKLYTDYLKKKEELDLIGLDESPTRPPLDPDKTVSETDEETANYELTKAKFDIKSRKLKFQVDRALDIWFRTTRKSEGVKKLIAEVETNLENVKTYKQQARDKAHLAKLSIAISDKDVRESIKNIVHWSEQLN